MSTEIKNISQLRESILSSYDKLSKGEMTAKDAQEIGNLSARVMSTCKLEISYAKHNNTTANISFLEAEKNQPI